MSKNVVRQLGVIAKQMLERRKELEAELRLINRVLALQGEIAQPPVKVRSRCYGALTDAVKAELVTGPKTKRQLVVALQGQGLLPREHPLVVLDSVIYTKHFIRQGKLFALTKRLP
jgi:hypothetical protein